ncbi:MAG: hypothetical protein SGARI_008337, partial [Bacillariaceae sp.]
AIVDTPPGVQNLIAEFCATHTGNPSLSRFLADIRQQQGSVGVEVPAGAAQNSDEETVATINESDGSIRPASSYEQDGDKKRPASEVSGSAIQETGGGESTLSESRVGDATNNWERRLSTALPDNDLGVQSSTGDGWEAIFT